MSVLDWAPWTLPAVGAAAKMTVQVARVAKAEKNLALHPTAPAGEVVFTSDEAFPDVEYGWGNIDRLTMLDRSSRAEAKREMMRKEGGTYEAMDRLVTTVAAHQKSQKVGRKEFSIRQAQYWADLDAIKEAERQARLAELRAIEIEQERELREITERKREAQARRQAEAYAESEQRRVERIRETLAKTQGVKAAFWIPGNPNPLAVQRYTGENLAPQVGDLWKSPYGNHWKITNRLWRDTTLHMSVEPVICDILTDGLGNETYIPRAPQPINERY